MLGNLCCSQGEGKFLTGRWQVFSGTQKEFTARDVWPPFLFLLTYKMPCKSAQKDLWCLNLVGPMQCVCRGKGKQTEGNSNVWEIHWDLFANEKPRHYAVSVVMPNCESHTKNALENKKEQKKHDTTWFQFRSLHGPVQWHIFHTLRGCKSLSQTQHKLYGSGEMKPASSNIIDGNLRSWKQQDHPKSDLAAKNLPRESCTHSCGGWIHTMSPVSMTTVPMQGSFAHLFVFQWPTKRRVFQCGQAINHKGLGYIRKMSENWARLLLAMSSIMTDRNKCDNPKNNQRGAVFNRIL